MLFAYTVWTLLPYLINLMAVLGLSGIEKLIVLYDPQELFQIEVVPRDFIC
jgi:hypothetical protein